MRGSDLEILSGVVLVTGNRHKLEEARRICGAPLESEAIDLPEIQSLDLERVLRAKGDEAWRRLGRPLIVEETGLELAAFGGFPGPLVRWMLEAIGPAGIARAVHALGETAAVARCGLLYLRGEDRILATGTTAGRIVDSPRGGGGFGWDSIFRPEGARATYAELPPEVKDRLSHRGKAWRRLLERLRSPL